MTTISNPKYLFRFFNIQKRENFLVYLTKLNTTSNRYDLFSIDLPNDLDLNTGEYKYFIYQSSDVLDFNYNDMLLLEEGRADVVKEFPNDKYYTINTIDTVNYVE